MATIHDINEHAKNLSPDQTLTLTLTVKKARWVSSLPIFTMLLNQASNLGIVIELQKKGEPTHD